MLSSIVWEETLIPFLTRQRAFEQVSDPFKTFPARNGEYNALDDETPRLIAHKFCVDLDAFVKINHHMYDGLHAHARFKGGTQTFLPTPCMASLRRPANVMATQIFSDIYKIITCALEVMPLCPRLQQPLAHWKATMQQVVDATAAAAEAGRQQDHAQGIKAVAHATLGLEHSFTLPVVNLAPAGDEQQEPRPVEMRLLPAHWLSSLRQNWVHEMESAATLSHMGLLLEEFNLHALASWRELRACSTSQWWFNNETKKWQRDQAQARGRASSETPLVRVPDAQDRVVYFRKGHCIHLGDIEYPEKPWDQCPDTAMALCLVQDRFFFRQLKRQAEVEHPFFCLLRLRPICQGKDLVKKKIYIYMQTSAQAGAAPPVVSATVEDFRQGFMDVQHFPMQDGTSVILPAGAASNGEGNTPAASAGGAASSGAAANGAAAAASNGDSKVVYTQRCVNEYLVRMEGGPSKPTWMSLDNCKYVMQRPEDGGEAFWVTLYYEQKHPEFLLKPEDFARNNVRWKPQTRVRMFWRNDDHPAGGEYYSGEVIEHLDRPDPWDSVHVRWDTEEGEDEDDDWVCPWELQVCHAPTSLAARRKAVPGGLVVRNAAEAARIPSGGYYTAVDEDSPNTIAQKKGLDVELIVLLNKEEHKGLTRYSKLVSGTKVKLPPKDYSYQRSGGVAVRTSIDGTVELQFPKEDEVFWEGAWTEDKCKVAEIVLKKVMRQRGIGPFLDPVDWEARGLDDYLTIVKTPMDLGKVEARFKGSDGEPKYATPQDFYRELRLVFQNAKSYNPDGSELHRKAVTFLNQFEDWWRDEKTQLEHTRREEQARQRKAYEKEQAFKRKQAMAFGAGLGAFGSPLGTAATSYSISAQQQQQMQTLTALLQQQQQQATLGVSPLNPIMASLQAMAAAGAAAGAGAVTAGTDHSRSTVSCGVCGGEGHNRRTCPNVTGGLPLYPPTGGSQPPLPPNPGGASGGGSGRGV